MTRFLSRYRGLELVLAMLLFGWSAAPAAQAADDEQEQPPQVLNVDPTAPQPATRTTFRSHTTAFAWLARQQAQDGSWDYALVPDTPRPVASRVEATAWVILAWASEGITHKHPGRYRVPMKKAAEFLLTQQRASPQGNDFSGKANSAVAHALATSAIATLFSLTQDEPLREPVQRAARLIVARQDPQSGGWRTATGEPADLATTYRQLAALLQAASALEDAQLMEAIRKSTMTLSAFRKAAEAGQSEENLAITAMYVICQMGATGKRDDPAWEPSIQRLLKRGPIKDNPLYNYYATQADFDWQGKESWRMWDQWLFALRKQLVATQIREGDEAGSWPPGPSGSVTDDRLYRTVLNTMTLSVYTRHMTRYFQFH